MSTAEAKQMRLEIAAKDLDGVLERLSCKHEQLFELLVAKENALVTVDMSALEECQSQEETVLRDVIEEEKERLLITEEIGDLLNHDIPAMIRVSEITLHLSNRLAEQLSATRDHLKATALRLARQNAVNRALIEHSIGHVQVFMSKLVNDEILGSGYGKSGQKPNSADVSFLMDRKG